MKDIRREFESFYIFSKKDKLCLEKKIYSIITYNGQLEINN